MFLLSNDQLKNQITVKFSDKNDLLFSLLTFVEFYALKCFIETCPQMCKFIKFKNFKKYIQNGSIKHKTVNNLMMKTAFELVTSLMNYDKERKRIMVGLHARVRWE